MFQDPRPKPDAIDETPTIIVRAQSLLQTGFLVFMLKDRNKLYCSNFTRQRCLTFRFLGRVWEISLAANYCMTAKQLNCIPGCLEMGGGQGVSEFSLHGVLTLREVGKQYLTYTTGGQFTWTGFSVMSIRYTEKLGQALLNMPTF